MLKKFPHKLSLISIGIVVVALIKLGDVSALSRSDPESTAGFSPKDSYKRTTHRVLAQLQHHHYKPLKINDDLSSILLDEYIDYLDKGRQLLTTQDITQFEQYRHKLDNQIENGKVDLAFEIYNVVHKKRVARTDYLISQIEHIDKIDFAVAESLNISNDDLPWPESEADLRNEWRKQFKNDVLSLKLSKKENKEIAEVLGKRYQNQSKRISEFKADDVYSTFMTVFTGIYDPHTTYMAPRDSENFDINMRLSLEGIGARLQREDDYTKIVNLVPGGPAQKSGQIKPSDKIIAVAQDKDGEMVDVVGWRLDDVVDLIRGPKGSTVRLQLITSDATGTTTEAEIQLVRDTIKLEDKAARKKIIQVKRGGKDLKIGVIELPTFYLDFEAYHSGDKNFRSSSRDVRDLIFELRKDEVDGIIVDLRNNGGGSLEEVGIITGLFIKQGPVVQVRKSNGYKNVLNDPDPSIAYDGPLAVMVNRLSASASEIFAGAIQDSGRGIVIGQRTFGKGTVQVLNDIKPGRIKFTNATFYRISGDSTQHRGVIPDIGFPSFIDEAEIGESAEKHALPWGQINPARYYYDRTIQQLLPKLSSQHESRIQDDIEFSYLNKRLELIEKNRSKNTLSLNIKEREDERKASQQTLLEMENAYRKQKSLPAYKSYNELEQANNEEEDKEADALAKETANILSDLIELSSNVQKKGEAILSAQKTYPAKLQN